MSAACLILALVTLAAGAEAVNVAGREYNVMEWWWKGAQGRLILDDGALLYTKYSDKKFHILKDGVDKMVEGLPDFLVNDLLLDSSGTVWVANFYGLHQFFRHTNTTTKFSDTHITKLTAAANGTIYGLAFRTRVLYAVIRQQLRAVPGMRAFCLAMSQAGDLYYTLYSDTSVLKKIGGPKGVVENITGLPANTTWYLEMDRLHDILYICHDDGLYFVRPGANEVEKVEGIEGPVLGVGFTPDGEIFVGSKDKVIKMFL